MFGIDSEGYMIYNGALDGDAIKGNVMYFGNFKFKNSVDFGNDIYLNSYDYGYIKTSRLIICEN